MTTFTPRQGQYLAFIHLYWLLHRRGPTEAEIAHYFRVSPPAAHLMVVKLHDEGLIHREPGIYRSARVAVPVGDLPDLVPVDGPSW